MSPQDSLAWRSHSGKLRVALGVLIVAGIAFIAGLISSDERIELLGNVAALIMLFALLALGYAVSCPSCGLRLAFHAMSTQGAGDWVHQLVYAESCPRCGFGAGAGAMSSNTSFERTREG
jgi:hypothetical protein